MAEHPGPEDRFGEALQKMIEQIAGDCGYRPEEYIQTVGIRSQDGDVLWAADPDRCRLLSG